VTDEHGASVSLADFRGSKVILYFYPEALTEACTTQACDFRDNLNSLKSAGYTVLGISRDEPAKLAEFTSKEGLNFDLLSDPDRAVHEAYGAWGEKSMYGKPVIGVIRSTFVIDEKGLIKLSVYNVKAKGHVAALRKKLGLD
jgi:peroxiredoxin Q/BCP